RRLAPDLPGPARRGLIAPAVAAGRPGGRSEALRGAPLRNRPLGDAAAFRGGRTTVPDIRDPLAGSGTALSPRGHRPQSEHPLPSSPHRMSSRPLIAVLALLVLLPVVG